MVNKIEIVVTASNMTKPGFDAAVADARAMGTKVGEDFTTGVGDQVKKDLPAEVEKPLEDSGKKSGTKAGQAAASGMSPLIIGAFTAAAAIGPAALLAGTGVAIAGVAALVLKGNATIAADYKQLGTAASTAITTAAAPLAGTVHQSLVSLSNEASALQPQLSAMFAASGPDLASFTTGLEGLVANTLPGVTSALQAGQVDVAAFAGSLPGLGSGIGSFFTGLTRDSSTTAAGLSSVMGVLSNTVGTLGTVIGSASSAISADLLALDPVINGLLTGVRAISNPATIGGVAGLFGAMKLDPAISTGLTSASTKLGAFAKTAVDGEGSLTRLGSVASGASGALGKMAGVMGGPWGLAIGAGIGLVSGLAGMMIQASHASDALTLSQQTLQQAIAQDNGQAGQATAAFVAQSAASDGLATSAKAAGVSIATWTQAVIGNKAAQDQVTAAVMKVNQAQDNNTVSLLKSQIANERGTDVNRGHILQTREQEAATNNLTDANAQLLNSMHAQSQQITDQINQQAQLAQATSVLDNTTEIFNATLNANYQAMVLSSQQSATTTVGALNLGTANLSLNQSLEASVQAYTQAQTQGNAYNSVLTALDGSINSLLGSEAAFTTALSGVSTAVKANGLSLDQNNAKGALNITTFTGIATAAQKAAAALYQNEVSTKGATVAYNDANAKLKEEKLAFIDAADNAGFAKGKVQELADELFALPPTATIQITANTNPALNAAQRLLNQIGRMVGTVTIAGSASGVGRTSGLQAYAHGGVRGAASGGNRGSLTLVGEEGPELADLPYGTTVHSNPDTQRMLSQMTGNGSSGVQKVILEVTGDPNSWFVQAIRHNVRVIAGNGPNSVQQAYG